jgi:hypothetical protein
MIFAFKNESNQQSNQLHRLEFFIGTSTGALFSIVILILEFYKILNPRVLREKKKIIVCIS